MAMLISRSEVVRSGDGDQDVDGLTEDSVVRAIDDDRVGIGCDDRASNDGERPLAQRILKDLVALDRHEVRAQQTLQPAIFEFTGEEIPDLGFEVRLEGK